jgi:hypothetical protein
MRKYACDAAAVARRMVSRLQTPYPFMFDRAGRQAGHAIATSVLRWSTTRCPGNAWIRHNACLTNSHIALQKRTRHISSNHYVRPWRSNGIMQGFPRRGYCPTQIAAEKDSTYKVAIISCCSNGLQPRFVVNIHVAA